MGMPGGYESVSMVEEKAAQGIQKLLQAEHEAAEVVALAKQDKVAKLKKAKEEAEAEIAAYKAQREQHFQLFQQQHSGGSATHKLKNDASVKSELDAINAQVVKNKDKMVDMLLQSVTTVND